ncbi:amidohydrolase family protein [Myxococcota bacterium]|nr:amidohydrolase family protein [Myxococcota bacterium]
MDLVIRGGEVIDGTGAAPRRADVAIQGDRIQAVGRVPERGRREIDADGLMVSPGFVDIHTHYDGQVSWDSLLTPSCWHGVTTVVMGNCGVGFAPVRPDTYDWLIALMEGVEDIPGAILSEGIDWSWESFPEYLDAIERTPHAIDFGAQLPHAALRAYVMGERGSDHTTAASSEEIRQMGALAREAVRAGALGFTTSRTINHRASDGRLTPTLTAAFEELAGIARGLREAGAGVIELVADFEDLETEFAMLRAVAAESGRLMSISVLQDIEDPEGWRRLLELIGAACTDGISMRGQVSPRPVGAMMSLDSWLHPFMGVPAFREVAELSDPERNARLRDAGVRQRILEQHAAEQGPEHVENTVINGFEYIFSLGDPPQYEPAPEDSIAERARRAGVDPAALAYDLLLENEARGQLYLPIKNYAHLDGEATREMLLDPHTVPGLGDGGAHCTFISDASFPTSLITHWGRDRTRGDRLPIEWLVKRQTRDTAEMVGLNDRGVVAPGFKADLNLIDFDVLKLRPPELVHDLPAGGKRLVQRADGYRATLVSGRVAFENGESTGEMPGRLVRGATPSPS